MLWTWFLKEESIESICNYSIKTEEGISQEFWLRQIRGTNNYFIKELDPNEFLSNKNKMVCTTLNYIEHFLTLFFGVTVCISFSGFASLLNIYKRIMASTIGLNLCAIIPRIKSYKWIIKENKKEGSWNSIVSQK